MRYPWAVFSPLLCYAVCKTAEGSVPILSQVCTGLSVKPGVIPSISEIVPLLPLRTFVAAGTEQYNHPSFRLTHFPLGNYPLLAKDWQGDGLCVNTRVWMCLGANRLVLARVSWQPQQLILPCPGSHLCSHMCQYRARSLKFGIDQEACMSKALLPRTIHISQLLWAPQVWEAGPQLNTPLTASSREQKSVKGIKCEIKYDIPVRGMGGVLQEGGLQEKNGRSNSGRVPPVVFLQVSTSDDTGWKN